MKDFLTTPAPKYVIGGKVKEGWERVGKVEEGWEKLGKVREN